MELYFIYHILGLNTMKKEIHRKNAFEKIAFFLLLHVYSEIFISLDTVNIGRIKSLIPMI